MKQPAFDWRDASPAAVFALAHEAIGCDGPTALKMSEIEVQRLGLDEDANRAANVVPLDWKNSNLHAVLYDAMRNGHEPPTAMVLANLAYERITRQVLIPKAQEDSEWFMAYPMYLIYDDAKGRRLQIKAWAAEGPVKRLYSSEWAQRIPKCPDRGDTVWFEVRRSDVNPAEAPSAGSTVFVRWDLKPRAVPAAIGSRRFDEFIELDSMDVDAIKIHCGDHDMGPDPQV